MFFRQKIKTAVSEFSQYLEAQTPQWVPESWIRSETRFYQKYLCMRYEGLVLSVVGFSLLAIYLALFKAPATEENWVDVIFIMMSLPTLFSGVIFMCCSYAQIETAPNIIKKMDFQTK